MPSEKPKPLSSQRLLPKFLQGRVTDNNKENEKPPVRNPHDTFDMSPPLKVPRAYLESQNADKLKMSADFSKVLKHLNLSPVANNNNNSLVLNPKPVECAYQQPRNPMIQGGYQMRTKLPTASSQANDTGGCTIF